MPKKGSSGDLKNARARLLTVSQTAGIIGISPSTLRLWENAGLIVSIRSKGGYRLYNTELLDLLKRIKYLRDEKKLNVPGIKQALGQTALKKGKERVVLNGNASSTLGAKLRKLRKSRNLGIVESAKRAKISPGFLSAIELARANASIATLQRLAAAYNTTVLEFFELPQQPRRLIKPEQRRGLSTASGVLMEVLSIGTKMLECMLFVVEPGAGSDGAYSHVGEEFIYMLSGTLEIWLDEIESYTLEAGDSFWFESNLGHRWSNPADEKAVLLWVNTPLTF